MPAKSKQKKKLGGGRKEGAARVVAESAGVQSRLLFGVTPAVIALVTIVVFLPTLRNGFVNWDDETYLLENLHYRGLGWRQIHWMFTTCYLSTCMPLTSMTYGLDYVFWGMNPVGYHLSSLLIHTANVVLFYFVSLRLLRLATSSAAGSRRLPIQLAAGFSALLFSLHPLQVEVVAWTLGREMAVAGFFFFLTLLCYLKAAEKESMGASRWRWMCAAWLFYMMSLLGKEIAMTLPFALIVLDVYPLRRLGNGRGKWFGSQVHSVWWEKVPFLLLAVAAGLRAVLGKQGTGAVYPIESYGLLPRLAQVLYSLAFYPWKILIPTGLSPLYPFRPFTELWNLPLLVSAVFVFSLTAALFFIRRRWPAGLAAWVFYAVLLAPLSGIVAFGPHLVADRFAYLPCAGLAVLAGAGLFYCSRLRASSRIGVRTLVFTHSLAVLLVTGLGVLSWHQTQIWHDSERLWRHALAIDEKSSFAHNNLGLILARRDALQEAINHFRRAVQIDPAFVEAHTNLGNFLALQGSRQEAIAHLRQALKIDPAFANAHNTLGNILADGGELDDAIEHFRKALQTDPQLAMVHYNLGRTLARRGDIELAVTHYRAALKITPADPDIHNNLGLLLASQGKLDEATTQFREALRLNPGYAKAYFNLGKVFSQQDRLDQAVDYFQQALRIQPAVAEIHENLARVFARQGKKSEAVKEYEEALRLIELRRKPGSAG